MPKPEVRVHLFRSDGIQVTPMRAGTTSCLDCPMPYQHPCHAVPDTTDQQAQARRWAGEEDHDAR